MISVRLLNILIGRSRRKVPFYEVRAAPGLTVSDVIADAGLEEKWVQIVLVNGTQAYYVTELADGDSVVLAAALAGG